MVRGLIHSRFITVQPIKQSRPQGFPLKNGWGATHFLREKPLGRGYP